MDKDILFKGCTRPAMVFGVPVMPFFIAVSSISLLAIWTKILLIILLIPVIFIMRLMTKSDDQQFRLLGLKLWFRLIPHYNFNRHFWKASTFSPLDFKKRRA